MVLKSVNITNSNQIEESYNITDSKLTFNSFNSTNCKNCTNCINCHNCENCINCENIENGKDL